MVDDEGERTGLVWTPRWERAWSGRVWYLLLSSPCAMTVKVGAAYAKPYSYKVSTIDMSCLAYFYTLSFGLKFLGQLQQHLTQLLWVREMWRVIALDIPDHPLWACGIINHCLLHKGWNSSVV